MSVHTYVHTYTSLGPLDVVKVLREKAQIKLRCRYLGCVDLAVIPGNLAVKPRNLAVQPSNLAVIPVKKVLGARGVDLAVDGIYVELPFLYKLQ